MNKPSVDVIGYFEHHKRYTKSSITVKIFPLEYEKKIEVKLFCIEF